MMIRGEAVVDPDRKIKRTDPATVLAEAINTTDSTTRMLASQLAAAILTALPEGWRLTYHDPRYRLIRAVPEVLEQWGTRTERGERITVEWGEPDAEGIYEPVFTAHTDDRLEPELTEERLAAVLPHALSSLTEGSDYDMAPEPSDEPGSPYVLQLAHAILAALKEAKP